MKNIVCIEDGVKMKSVRIIPVDHPLQFMFKVKFSNGYENIFFEDNESGEWIEQDLGFTSLADEVGKQMKSDSPGFRKKITWFTLPGYTYCFGYVRYESDNIVVYEIYNSNRRYMFSVIKNAEGLWQILMIEGENLWDYPNYYENEIPFIIDLYSL